MAYNDSAMPAGSKGKSFVTRWPENLEILRVTNEGDVFMRTAPDGGKGRLVRVELLPSEIHDLHDCREPFQAIAVLAGIIARMSRPN